MLKFNLYTSLIIMFIGVCLASTPLVICGFLSTNIWAATEIVVKVIKHKGNTNG